MAFLPIKEDVNTMVVFGLGQLLMVMLSHRPIQKMVINFLQLIMTETVAVASQLAMMMWMEQYLEATIATITTRQVNRGAPTIALTLMISGIYQCPLTVFPGSVTRQTAQDTQETIGFVRPSVMVMAALHAAVINDVITLMHLFNT